MWHGPKHERPIPNANGVFAFVFFWLRFVPSSVVDSLDTDLHAALACALLLYAGLEWRAPTPFKRRRYHCCRRNATDENMKDETFVYPCGAVWPKTHRPPPSPLNPLTPYGLSLFASCITYESMSIDSFIIVDPSPPCLGRSSRLESHPPSIAYALTRAGGRRGSPGRRLRRGDLA